MTKEATILLVNDHREDKFTRDTDDSICIVRSDAVRWLDDKHQTFHITVFSQWTRETTNKYIDSSLNGGPLPLGFIPLVAWVNEGWIFAYHQNSWYCVLATMIYLDDDGKELRKNSDPGVEEHFFMVQKDSWQEKLLQYALDYLK